MGPSTFRLSEWTLWERMLEPVSALPGHPFRHSSGRRYSYVTGRATVKMPDKPKEHGSLQWILLRAVKQKPNRTGISG